MNIKRTIIFTITTIVLLLSTVSCEVGLGEAVDTQDPKVSIQTPPVDAIIRGNFAIGGNWTDDSVVDKVDITLKRTDIDTPEKKIYEGVPVTVKEGQGTWSVLIKPEDFKIKDGTYQITVEAYDPARHVNKDSRLITIDNTEPIIVLDRPASKENSNNKLIDGYGQKLSILGRAADDNSVDSLKVDF